MKYTMPQVVLAGSALALIQGNGKPNHFNKDNWNGDTSYDCTTPAYEADE
jgi:hypothetical protein